MYQCLACTAEIAEVQQLINGYQADFGANNDLLKCYVGGLSDMFDNSDLNEQLYSDFLASGASQPDPVPWPTLNTPCQQIVEDNKELELAVEIAAGMTDEQKAYLAFVEATMCGAVDGQIDEVITAYATIDDLYASQNALELIYLLNRPDLMKEHPDWWNTNELFVQERHDYVFARWEEAIASGLWGFPCSDGQPLCYPPILETFVCDVPDKCFEVNPNLVQELDLGDAMADEITFQNNYLNYLYSNLEPEEEEE